MAQGEVELAALAASQHGVVLVRQLLELAMAESTVRRRRASGELIDVQPGVVRHRAHPDTWRGRLLAACLSTGGIASHRSAAIVWGLSSISGRIVEVTVDGRAASRRHGVVVHHTTQFNRTDPVVIDRIPVTGMARTLLDLAAVDHRRRRPARGPGRPRLPRAPGGDRAAEQTLAPERPQLRCRPGPVEPAYGDGLAGLPRHLGVLRRRARRIVPHRPPSPATDVPVRSGVPDSHRWRLGTPERVRADLESRAVTGDDWGHQNGVGWGAVRGCGGCGRSRACRRRGRRWGPRPGGPRRPRPHRPRPGA